MTKETIIGFISNVLAVILGIVITFAVQGMIDNHHDKKEVASALELVRTELSTNIDDIQVMSGYLQQEKRSARYLLDNRNSLGDCPRDSVEFHSSMLFADAAITVSYDALELLKSSSLFQKIGDNTVAMAIIRAYDTCGAIVTNMNRHIENRTALLESSINPQSASLYASEGAIDIGKFIQTAYGSYAVGRIANQPDVTEFNDVSDVEDALEAIEKYIHKRR